MAFQPIGADDDGNLPPQVEAKLATTYAPQFPASTVIVTDPVTGNVTSVTTNGVLTEYTYNPDGSVDTDECNGVIRDYGYDGSGNLTSITARP